MKTQWYEELLNKEEDRTLSHSSTGVDLVQTLRLLF